MLQKIGHIVLIVWMLLSSTGLLVNRHFCANELKSWTLFVEATPCHEESVQHCPFHPPEASPQKNCCNNEAIFLKWEAEQSAPVILQVLPVSLAVIVFPEIVLTLPFSSAQTPEYLTFKPPLLVCDLFLRLQTFRC